MKKILGLAVLMMVMLISVSGLADADDSVNVPVHLNVQEFMRLTVDTSSFDSTFDLTFDPATGATTEDTVVLKAEANVSYKITFETDFVVIDSETNVTWDSLVDIIINNTANSGDLLTDGEAGVDVFNVTAYLDVSNSDGVLEQGALEDGHIADVTFTIIETL